MALTEQEIGHALWQNCGQLTGDQVRELVAAAVAIGVERERAGKTVAQVLATLTGAMKSDPDFAHSWQCNIAMPIFDGANGKLTIGEANNIATTLMRHLFGVEYVNPYLKP
jgi:hypothetical protein